ncbi:MAG TPA: right-handed parallel beta-helix repeat-containing protein [Acidobacteriaceae bacterium]
MLLSRPISRIFAFHVALCTVLTATAFRVTASAQTIHVSPSGNDHAAGTSAAPVRSIEHAVILARATPQHAVILKAGVYRLTTPLTLTAADSGLSLSAAPGNVVTLNGGTRITEWQPDGAKRGFWFASLPAGVLLPRQIYIDGVRANRTRGLLPVKLTMSEAGYTADSDLLAHWRHPDEIEFVYTGGNGIWGTPSVGVGDWTEPRCPVAAIHGSTIEMVEPCWQNSTHRVMLPNGSRTANLVGPASIGKQPSYIENAYELLGRPGEFYVDSSTRKIFYTPRQGEDLRRADVEIPVLESLLKIDGTAASPAKDITLTGITFAYASWHDPSTPEGFSEIQANYRVTGADGATKQALCTLVPGGTCPFGAWTPEPGNVSAQFADTVRFTHDTFTHLGAAGLSFNRGAHGNVVEGCIFTDISGNGLELANVDTPEAPDAEFAVNNRVENNLFRNVGAEFRGGIPIVVGYARYTHIAHNQVDHVPYAGISIGWGGWPDKIALPGVANRSTGNVIEKNRISRFMLVLSDGGGIYTQGRTGQTLVDGELVSGNVVDDQFSTGHALYTDNGSSMITVRGNVIFNTNFDNWGSRHKDYYDGGKGDQNDPLAIEDNWWEQGDPDSSNKQITIKGNHIITALAQAPAALLDSAGLESNFRAIATPPALKTASEPPSSVSAFATQADAYITWRPPVFDGGSPITRYIVSSDDGLTATIFATDFDRLSYARVHLAPSTKSRVFTVAAVNAAGTSVISLPSLPVSTRTEPLALPDAPQAVSVHVEGSRASIHFGAPKEHGGEVLAYVVMVDSDANQQTFTGHRLITLQGRHRTFVTLDGLPPGKTHRFGVAAVNPSGMGAVAWSDAK